MKETTVVGEDCKISVTLQDNSGSTWVYNNCKYNSSHIYAVFSDGTEAELKENGYAYLEHLNSVVKSGEILKRIEIRNSANKAYRTWTLNLEIKKSTTFKCTLNSNDSISVQE